MSNQRKLRSPSSQMHIYFARMCERIGKPYWIKGEIIRRLQNFEVRRNWPVTHFRPVKQSPGVWTLSCVEFRGGWRIEVIRDRFGRIDTPFGYGRYPAETFLNILKMVCALLDQAGPPEQVKIGNIQI
jgi:hypothetical protein